MDYEHGLSALKRMAKGTAWYQDFAVHEAALRENLRDERRYGPSEQTRRDRTRIVDQLNALALQHLGISFNDLCLDIDTSVRVQVPHEDREIGKGDRATAEANTLPEAGDTSGLRQRLQPFKVGQPPTPTVSARPSAIPQAHPDSVPLDQGTARVTWLHLSDLHFRKSQAYDENVVLKALLRDLFEQQVHPDFVAVSGDIAFSGQPIEYDLARRFFNDLLQTTGLDKDRLFLVPGNHDVDRSLISTGARAIGESLSDRKSANALLSTPTDRKLVFARFKGYAAFVRTYLGKEVRFDDSRYFYVQSLDLAGQQVALLGLNSAYMCASDQDKANGLLIGERQARAALEQAAGASLKIALLHHPFDWLREFDQNDSAAMLTDGCDFVLHGHLHQTAATQLTSPDGAATILACGACYETREFPNMYNWVQLDLTASVGTVYLRRYSDARGGFWAKDTLTYKNAPDGVYRFRLAGQAARGSTTKVGRSTGMVGDGDVIVTMALKSLGALLKMDWKDLRIISMNRTDDGGLQMAVGRQFEVRKQVEGSPDVKRVLEEKRYDVEADEQGRVLYLNELRCGEQ